MLNRAKRQRRHGAMCIMAAALAMAPGSIASAQHVAGDGTVGPRTHFVVPQSRSFTAHHAGPTIVVDGVEAKAMLTDAVASTTLDIVIRNTSAQQEEAVLLIPVAADAAVSSFMFEGAASEPVVEVLRRDEARKIYDSIVASVRDPALLEFAGYNLVRSSVFPVAAKSTQRVRLTYEHVLESDGSALAYMLPRSQSLDHRVPWSIEVKFTGRQAVASVYSPTHEIETTSNAVGEVQARLAPHASMEPGPFRLFLLRENGALPAALMAYPDPTIGGGYFLLATGLPTSPRLASQLIKRDVTIVFDRSGSMIGEKMDQARRALRLILESLQPGETFNIIDFGTSISKFAPAPCAKDDSSMADAMKYVEHLTANGGTNTFAAVHEALRQAPPEGSLPMVLFLTDGLPTIGRTTEHDIRALVEKGNAHRKRIYTFGVGHDVNGALLDRLADVSRGVAAYVQPKEDISTVVASTIRKLQGPVFTDLSLAVLNADKSPAPGVLSDLQPTIIPDIFLGDQLVLLGRYTREQPVVVRLHGNYRGTPRAFDVTFDLSAASTRHDFVPRLWATRRIAALIDLVRQDAHASDAHMSAAVQEIVELSTRFGILTEYTAFLAREGTDLGNVPDLISACRSNLESRAVGTRWGEAAINQSINWNAQKVQSNLKRRNDYIDERMQRVEFHAVQQIADCALYNRGGTWIDSRLASQHAQAPQREIVLGSPEHHQLVDRLIAQGRQALLAMPGDVLLLVDGERVLIVNDVPPN